ncbi:MAG TPA: hypothetical protein VGF48_19270 [Thermoanaerobaculia bacterium]
MNFTLITLWTAGLLYSGLATSLAWGERDKSNPIMGQAGRAIAAADRNRSSGRGGNPADRRGATFEAHSAPRPAASQAVENVPFGGDTPKEKVRADR